MDITRRTLGRWTLALMGAAASAVPSLAADMPKPFDKPGDVKIALVRYLSTGDFFQSYLAGVEAQAKRSALSFRSSTAVRTPRSRPIWSIRR